MESYLHDTEGVGFDVARIKEEPIWFEECAIDSGNKTTAKVVPNYADDYYSPWVTYSNTFIDDQWISEYANIKMEPRDFEYTEHYTRSKMPPYFHQDHMYHVNSINNSFMSFSQKSLEYGSRDYHKRKPIKREPKMAEIMLPLENFSTPKRKAGTKRKRGEGKSRTGTPTSYTTVPLPPCKVCSGVATGFHFGVITCEACKAFFRRALIHKQEYKCTKNDDCEIIDKKLGNCSACRLKKCFALGMSKGGVRRGRYSIAIRTKAIVEAKALESKAAAETINQTKRIRTESEESLADSLLVYPDSNSSPDSGMSSDFSDGFQDISDVDAYSLTVTIDSPTQSIDENYLKNYELECLIDALLSCQEAVYPNLKKQFQYNMEDVQYKVYEEYTLKQELFGDLFGKTETVSTEEYQQIFAETGIDLDDRLAHFNKKGKSMEESIAQYVNFAKIIPGFKNLNPKDVSRLLKAAHLEFWMFGNYKLMNEDLGVCSSWDGSHGTTLEHMQKFFERESMEKFLAFSTTLKRLNLTIEELAIVRVILLTYTDRCTLLEPEKIQTLQDKFLECLQYHLTKTVAEPMVRLYQIFDRLLAIRDLTHINTIGNRKFLTEWSFVMQDYPLWKEMLSFDEI